MNYLSIRLNTLKPDISLGFDLFIKLPSKYIHYINSNDSIDTDVIDRLKTKKVRKVYIKDIEEDLYLDYLDRCLNDSFNDKNLTAQKKTELVTSISINLSEAFYSKEIDLRAYQNVQKAGGALIDFVSSDSGVLSNIFNMKKSDDDSLLDKILQHAISTSALCIGFATSLDMRKEEIENLSIAGLMHDLAFMKMSNDVRPLFFKSINEMKPHELIEYKKHPTKGLELLSDKPFATKEIVELIVTHEEKISGEGFPNKLTKLTTIQEIHSLCCYFDREVNCLDVPKEQAIKNLMLEQIGNYNMDLLKKFQKFIKSEV